MSFFINPENIEKWPLEKHIGVISRLLVDGQNMTVLWSRWEPKATAPEHTHPHEQVGVVLKGQIEITVNGQTFLVNEGEYYYIPSNAPHAETNVSQVFTVLTDFFSPIRNDLLQHHFEPQTVAYEKKLEE